MPPPLATLDPSSRIDKCTNSFPPRTEIPVSNNPINEVEGFDFRRRGEERKKEEGNGRENKQIIARKLMSTLGPSQLFKPNDGDRKKEENGRKRRRVGKTRNKEREKERGGSTTTAQLAATISWYRLLSVPPRLCLHNGARDRSH